MVPVVRLLFFLALFVASALAADTAFVRVNQLGYEVGSAGRAYLMSPGPQNKSTFRVVRSDGTAAFSGRVGAKSGNWGAFTVYALDFTVTTAGTYTIVVDGALPATSPSFRIEAAKKLYSQALANALSFYQNERDGADFIPSPLRTAAGHLLDQQADVYESPQFDNDDFILDDLKPTGDVIDASGGWWDAGDYLKFVQTHSYTIALMLIGSRDFPGQMGAGGSADFTNEAKFGLQWLQKMWNDESQTLYYQVGIGTDFLDDPSILSDHDVWRLPQVDDTLGGTDPALRYIRNRPVFRAGSPGTKISPNLAGRLAADFAECSQVYRDSQPDFANRCLLEAEHIFALGDTSPGQLITTAPFDFYGEWEWRDDMELGATELYFALASARGTGIVPAKLPQTDPRFYLSQAAHWAHEYITGPGDAGDTLNLYDVSGLAHFELFRAIGLAGHPRGLEVSQAQLLRDLRKELENGVAQAKADPFGYGFPWDAYDTTTHGTGLSVMAREYSFLTKSKSFDQFSRRWAGNVLGANAWGSSFIVGDGEVFPYCMQHQVANILGSRDGTAPVLSGAVVEGPNTFAATGYLEGMRKCPPDGVNQFKQFNGNRAIYKDAVQSYSTVEPAIDLSASSMLMFAWQIAGAPETLVPNRDIPAAIEKGTFTPNPQWPPRRSRARRQVRRGLAAN